MANINGIQGLRFLETKAVPLTPDDRLHPMGSTYLLEVVFEDTSVVAIPLIKNDYEKLLSRLSLQKTGALEQRVVASAAPPKAGAAATAFAGVALDPEKPITSKSLAEALEQGKKPKSILQLPGSFGNKDE